MTDTTDAEPPQRPSTSLQHYAPAIPDIWQRYTKRQPTMVDHFEQVIEVLWDEAPEKLRPFLIGIDADSYVTGSEELDDYMIWELATDRARKMSLEHPLVNGHGMKIRKQIGKMRYALRRWHQDRHTRRKEAKKLRAEALLASSNGHDSGNQG